MLLCPPLNYEISEREGPMILMMAAAGSPGLLRWGEGSLPFGPSHGRPGSDRVASPPARAARDRHSSGERGAPRLHPAEGGGGRASVEERIESTPKPH
eukprot:COSAG01_NODE_53623_length_337_cov_48.474790_1_plen_97_part_10